MQSFEITLSDISGIVNWVEADFITLPSKTKQFLSIFGCVIKDWTALQIIAFVKPTYTFGLFQLPSLVVLVVVIWERKKLIVLLAISRSLRKQMEHQALLAWLMADSVFIWAAFKGFFFKTVTVSQSDIFLTCIGLFSQRVMNFGSEIWFYCKVRMKLKR